MRWRAEEGTRGCSLRRKPRLSPLALGKDVRDPDETKAMVLDTRVSDRAVVGLTLLLLDKVVRAFSQ